MTVAPAEAWARALAEWAIPDDILAAAPESPWTLPPELFRDQPAAPPIDTPSRRAALEALAGGGTVLDVGCGGGAASLPLAPPADAVVGVDERQAMLDLLVESAAERRVRCRPVAGRWPDVAADVDPADLVVCHHVVYNVADVDRFVVALTDHARRRVVVELTERHPQSMLNDLWARFWGLGRPTEPTAALFADVVRATGPRPAVVVFERESRRVELARADRVAFVRRRLCLGPERDAEIDEALGADLDLAPVRAVCVSWDP